MVDDHPVWRQGFDVVEAAAAPRLERLVNSEPFHVAMGLVVSVRKQLQRRAERTMRRGLHLLNLPAGSDVTRILNEMGKLQRDVRDLARRIDEQGEVSDGRNGRSSGSARADTTRP
jgi:hypothetical protein